MASSSRFKRAWAGLDTGFAECLCLLPLLAGAWLVSGCAIMLKFWWYALSFHQNSGLLSIQHFTWFTCMGIAKEVHAMTNPRSCRVHKLPNEYSHMMSALSRRRPWRSFIRWLGLASAFIHEIYHIFPLPIILMWMMDPHKWPRYIRRDRGKESSRQAAKDKYYPSIWEGIRPNTLLESGSEYSEMEQHVRSRPHEFAT